MPAVEHAHDSLLSRPTVSPATVTASPLWCHDPSRPANERTAFLLFGILDGLQKEMVRLWLPKHKAQDSFGFVFLFLDVTHGILHHIPHLLYYTQRFLSLHFG